MPDTFVTVNQSGGADFTTLGAAIAASDVTDGFYQILIEDNARYAENGLILGGSTGVPNINNYMWITVADASYHGGVVETGARVHPNISTHTFEVEEAFIHLEKLNIMLSSAAGSSDECFRIDAGDFDGLLFERCIIDSQDRNGPVSDGDGIYVNGADPTLTLYNCLFVDAGRICQHHNRTSGIINNEFVTVYYSTTNENATSQQAGIVCPRNSIGAPFHNCFNTVVARTGGSRVLPPPAADFREVGGLVTITGSNNASEDTSAIGTGPITGVVPASTWTDPNPPAFDLTLLNTNSVLYQAGVNRSASLPDSRITSALIDIKGDTRPDPPSIGAFDIAAAPPAANIFVGANPVTATNFSQIFVGSTQVFP